MALIYGILYRTLLFYASGCGNRRPSHARASIEAFYASLLVSKGTPTLFTATTSCCTVAGRAVARVEQSQNLPMK